MAVGYVLVAVTVLGLLQVPLDRLLVETDAPFLTPMPYRGRPNAPYLVPLTVRALAGVLSVHIEQLCEEVTRTAQRVFGNW